MRRDGKDTDKEDEEPEIPPQVSHSKWSSEQKRKREKAKTTTKAETDRYDLVSFCFSSYRKCKMRMKYRGLD